MKLNHTLLITLIVTLGAMLMPSASAFLTLNSVVFDPQIIASGDSVDVIIQYGADSVASGTSIEASNTEYTFLATLYADDDLTRNYTIVTKSVGDELARTILGGQIYAQRFRVKVLSSAPAGNYQFKLEGQWYKNGVAVSSPESVKVFMPVKKQGIVLSVANIQTAPLKIRSGDKDVQLDVQVSNSGEKIARNIEVALIMPEGMQSSQSNNNRVNLGTIAPQSQTTAHFTLDTDKTLPSGVSEIHYVMTYEDIDANSYVKNDYFAINVHKRPYLMVTNVSGTGLAGDTAQLKVTVQNVGEDVADSSDIRLVKQSSQPFEMDVRTQYLGQLKPGESASAVFDIDVLSDATLTTHKITAALRAKGNSNDGDESVYTFTDAVSLPVTGTKNNPYPLLAGIGAIVLILVIVLVKITRKK